MAQSGGGGAFGNGGAGITGRNLTIIKSGTIAGGLSGTGVQASPITFTGGTNILQLQSGSTITGTVVAFSNGDTLQLGGTTAGSFNVAALGGSGQYQNFGSYQKVGSGTWTLTGTSTSTTSWTVATGTLNVSGSIASAALTTVQGGILTGTGIVGATVVSSGGTFSPGTANTPGTSMTVSGTLSFSPGATYQVYVSPTASTMANVSGTVTLAGTVAAAFSSGSYAQNSYTVLHSAGLGGTTFSNVATTNLPAGFTASLGYSATDVTLNLVAVLGQSQSSLSYASALNGNQFNVASSLNGYFNSGGALPPAFVSVFALTGNNLTSALSQLSGEPMTGGRIAGVTITNQFLGTMLDPCGSGRGCSGGSPAGASAALMQAPSDACETCDGEPMLAPRWSAWASGFGGGGFTNGNAAVGSNSVTANTYGFAAGLDFNYSRETLFGIALSSGGSNWWLGNGLGYGASTSLQVGLYSILPDGPAYLALGGAFGNHNMRTNRSAVGDALAGSFNAQSYSVRAEAGYRFDVLPPTSPTSLGVTPYGGVQFQDFHSPAYSETDLSGLGLGLAYNASDATYTRTELGVRLDSKVGVAGTPLVVRGKLAWAHDFISNPGITASFLALPGSSFVVTGTTPPTDSALVSVSGEYAIAQRVTLGAKFDGDFSGQAQGYTGMASIRFSW